jgi:hypothetical protein
MAHDSEVSVAFLTRGIAGLEDADDETAVAAAATGRRTPETTTPRDKARSQMLWMLAQARRAAKNGRVEDARWWRDRATCALWNMN